MDLNHVWHDDRTLFQILRSAMPVPILRPLGQGLRLWIFALNLYNASFGKAFDGFDSCLEWIDIWYSNASEKKSPISGELSKVTKEE